MPEAMRLRTIPRWLALAVAAIAVYGCATPNYPIEGGAPTPRASAPIPPEAATLADLASLPGWTDEDHAAAFAAFQAGCRIAKDPELYQACREARQAGALSEAEARDYFEKSFRARPVGGDGLLTGYFVPEYEARDTRADPFTAPVRPRPADLVAGADYADRAAIEASPPDHALAWMRPEDLFFMQIQGSGVLDFPDGRRMKAVFAGSNGRPFTPVAPILRANGAVAPNGGSGDSVHAWLADHRGPDADAVMQANARYVFFDVRPDDGLDPIGTAGLALSPGRAIAVDPALHPLGGLYWIDATAPTLAGAAPVYRRMAMALDTGGAIRGPVRADLYVGRGAAAGVEAGHIRHALTLYELVPVADPAP